MDAALLLVGLALGLGAGVAAAAAVVGRARPGGAFGGLAAGHEATVRAAVDAAVDTVIKVAGERLGAQAEAGSRELASRSAAFEQRVGELRGTVADELAVRNAAVEAHMGDVRAELARVAELVGSLQRERAEQHGRVETRLSEMAAVSARLADTTQSLRQALANPRARGQWGERMADDVLRAAGLVEGISYRKQQTLPDGTRPDITFLLPDDRVQHMDVKFPLAGYLRWCEATTDAEEAKALADFLRDVRQRVRELQKPGYADESTTGFVLLFIPNEAVYGFIHGHDPGLADEALARKVVLCSPFTLFAVLGVIRQAADAVAVQHGADEVLELLAGFTKQWDQFTERLDAMGKQLQTLGNTYDQVNGPRRRQLEKQLDRVDDVRQRRGLEPPDDSLREVSNW